MTDKDVIESRKESQSDYAVLNDMPPVDLLMPPASDLNTRTARPREDEVQVLDFSGYELTKPDLVSEAFSKISKFNKTSAHNWIRDNYPLVDAATFSSEAAKRADGAVSSIGRFFSSGKSTAHYEDTAINKLAEERSTQFESLQKQALMTGPTADKAKIALMHIASGTDITGNPGLSLNVGDERSQRYNRDWSVSAASTLEQAATGKTSKELTAACMETILREKDLPGHMALGMIAGLKKFHSDKVVSDGQFDDALTTAVNNELNKPREQQTLGYQAILILLMQGNPKGETLAEPLKQSLRSR